MNVKKETPLVSVCIPCYNAENLIGETLDSILNQTYQNIEIIISDDKSTDNTIEVIQQYKDPRIRLILNEKNSGVVGNYNKVLAAAKGEYIKLQCADDLYEPDCIEKQLNIFLDNPDMDLVMVTSEKWIINKDSKRLFKKPFPGKGGFYTGTKAIKKTVRCGTNIIGEPGCPMLRRDIVEKVNYVTMPKDLTYLSESDLWCKMLKNGNLYVIKEPLFSYRIIETSDSVKNQRWKQAKSFNRWVNEFVDKKVINLSLLDKVLSRTMATCLCLGRNIVYVFANKKK